jgi:hypothetical protein
MDEAEHIPAGPCTDDDDVSPFIDDTEVYRLLKDIQDGGTRTIKKLGQDTYISEEVSRPIRYCGDGDTFYTVQRDTPQGNETDICIESKQLVLHSVKKAIEAANILQNQLSHGRPGWGEWEELQRKWKVYLNRIEQYLKVRTLKSKHEVRTLIRAIESKLDAIIRWPGSSEAKSLQRDIFSFFREPTGYKITWRTAPDKDPANTVAKIQGFIQRVRGQDLEKNWWKEINSRLGDLEGYYSALANKMEPQRDVFSTTYDIDRLVRGITTNIMYRLETAHAEEQSTKIRN